MVNKITGAITPLEEVAKINEIIDNLGGKEIGEIFYSLTPQTGAGYHLADGTLISAGTYAAFVNHMADLYEAEVNCFCTEAEWQTSITTYGACGKFVYDSVNNTVRLPKVTGFIEGTIDANTLGDLVEAGLPSIEHTHDVWGTTGAGDLNHGTYTDWYGSRPQYRATGTNSAVSSIYGNSDTVQPQATLGYIYIVISNVTKTAIQSDIDEIAMDLNGKADTDLTNINQTGENKIMNICAPDYANKESKSVNTTYTADADGYLICRVDGASIGAEIYINEILVATVPVYTSYYCVANAVVAKGDTYRFRNQNGTYEYGYFVPMKGAN